MKNTLISAIVAVLVAGGIVIFSAPKAQPPYAAQSEQLTVGTCIEKEGVRTCYSRQKMNTASTTVCSYKVPNATSTVITATGSFTTGSTSALYWEWGKSGVSDATTTSLGKAPLAGGVQATILASTTAGDFTGGNLPHDPPQVVAPNNFVNLKYGGALCGTGGTTCNTIAGYCDYAVTQNTR